MPLTVENNRPDPGVRLFIGPDGKFSSNQSPKRPWSRAFLDLNGKLFGRPIATTSPIANWGIPIQVLMTGSFIGLLAAAYRGDIDGIWLGACAVLLLEIVGLWFMRRD